ncbi:ankyrin, partial [Tuber magnatum]
VVRLLIGKGANMYPIDHMGATLMHTAAQEGHEETVLALAERMGQGCINSRNYWGDTPMHLAASNSHVAVVEILFRLGADINAVREDGASPLTLAVSMGSPGGYAELLIKRGADPTIRDDEGSTPLN